MRTVAASWFWTVGNWYDPVTLGIRWFSRPHWYGLAEVSHMGLEFCLVDDEGLTSYVVAESLGREGFRIKPSRLTHRERKGLKVIRWVIPGLEDEEMEAMYSMARKWDGRKPYDHPLIAKLAWRGSLLGRAIHVRVRGNGVDRADCSESACYIPGTCAPRWDLRELVDGKLEPWGAITPQDALDRVRMRGALI